ncbi:MAG: hypothetical protein ACT4PM_08750 [Gemmatimonadales bacterium]
MVAKVFLGVLAVAGVGALKVWTADLDPKGGSRLDGTARVETVGPDSLAATVNLEGAGSYATHTWGIHSGKCSAIGVMHGMQSAYPAVKADSAGNGMATARIKMSLGGGDHSVVVHGPAAGSVEACGDLKPSGE